MAPVTLGKQHLYKRPGFDSVVTWFVLIVVAVASLTIVSSTLYVVFHNYVRVPYYDEWEMIGHWNDKWRNVDLGWRHLFDQHNEHSNYSRGKHDFIQMTISIISTHAQFKIWKHGKNLLKSFTSIAFGGPIVSQVPNELLPMDTPHPYCVMAP